VYPRVMAERLRAEAVPLARRWLERLDALLAVDRDEIFPTDELLDHIPQLINEIAEYLVTPNVEEFAANTLVVARARELGLLRHAQQASVHQLLREYRLLGAILQTFVAEETERLDFTPTPADVLAVAAGIGHALGILQQTTIDTFIAEYTDRIAAQQMRLESFSRLVSHELRQPLGTLQFATRNLRSIGADERGGKLIDVVERCTERLVYLTAQLERISGIRVSRDDPARQEIDVAVLAKEVARQLREMAELRGVEVRVADDLPVIESDAGRLELALVNLISNGIKYSDPSKLERFVEIFRSGASDDGRTICIRDNGLGIPAQALPRIFEGTYRAHPDRDTELGIQGSGIGLAIVAECVDAIGGRLNVASVEGEGTAFDLWLPAKYAPPAALATSSSNDRSGR
jgi:signal transduction histidine kinase